MIKSNPKNFFRALEENQPRDYEYYLKDFKNALFSDFKMQKNVCSELLFFCSPFFSYFACTKKLKERTPASVRDKKFFFSETTKGRIFLEILIYFTPKLLKRTIFGAKLA